MGGMTEKFMIYLFRKFSVKGFFKICILYTQRVFITNRRKF